MKLVYNLALLLSISSFAGAMVSNSDQVNTMLYNATNHQYEDSVLDNNDQLDENNGFQKIWIKEDLYKEIELTDDLDRDRLQDSDYIVLLAADNNRYKRVSVCKDTYRSLLDYKNNQNDIYNKSVQVDWNQLKALNKEVIGHSGLFGFIKDRLYYGYNNKQEVLKEIGKGSKEISKETFEVSKEVPGILKEAFQESLEVAKEAKNIVKEVSEKVGPKAKNIATSINNNINLLAVVQNAYTRVTKDVQQGFVQSRQGIREDMEALRQGVREETQNLQNIVNNTRVSLEELLDNATSRGEQFIGRTNNEGQSLLSSITNNAIKFSVSVAGISIFSWLALKYINSKFKEKKQA